MISGHPSADSTSKTALFAGVASNVTAFREHPAYQAALLRRPMWWGDLRVLSGRLSFTLEAAGGLSLDWVKALVLRVNAPGARIVARVQTATALGSGRVLVVTERLRCGAMLDATLPATTVINARLNRTPEPAAGNKISIHSFPSRAQATVARSKRACIVHDFLAHRPVRMRNRNRLAQFRDICDNPAFAIKTDQLYFAFHAPGAVLQEHWLRTLSVRVHVDGGSVVAKARIRELIGHDAPTQADAVSTAPLTPRLNLSRPLPTLCIEIVSARERFKIKGLAKNTRGE